MTQLPNTLGKFVWHYLKPHNWCLVGFIVTAIIRSIDMSLAPYLLKLMINGVSQFPNEKSKAISLILMPAIGYIILTLKEMDRILVFDSGKIIEDGALTDLLKNKAGHFYKLWEMQASGFIPS